MGRCEKFVADVSSETIEIAKNKDITMGEFCFLKTTKKDIRYSAFSELPELRQ